MNKTTSQSGAGEERNDSSGGAGEERNDSSDGAGGTGWIDSVPVVNAKSAEPIAQIAKDLVFRGLPVAPFGIIIGALIGGKPGALSVAYGVGIVLINFLLSAFMLVWAVRISFALVTSVALGGFFFRLALISLAFLLVKDATWIHMVLFCMTIIITHLGLLVWELRFVSASYAHPGLKPTSGSSKPAAGYR